jgi:beta-galactosidase/beta-glucuronidase
MRILLHFGGVDYECEAWIDGQSVGKHWGGAVSFTFDVTRFVRAGGGHNLVVTATDDVRSGVQPGGKQRQEFGFERQRCHYTRTTGIWATVWLEAAHSEGIRGIQIVPDLDEGRLILTPRFFETKAGHRFRVRAVEDGRTVAEADTPAADGISTSLRIPEARPWAPSDPFLYDLELEVVDRSGAVLDGATSYAGLRKIHVEGNRIFLNNEPLYLRLVLDQGFYPDGIWTAPTDDDLRGDIELSKAAGFNGARLHQKVFEERFHYWADRLGYLTWGEYTSWGIVATDPVGARNMLSEWAEIVARDRNHPSIIAWTPLNETRQIEADPRHHWRFHADLYELTKALDPTRPVNETSGYIHVRTDLWTVHDYTQDPDELRRILTPDPQKGVFRKFGDKETEYTGQPYLIDEFGGIKWIPPGTKPYLETSWGYGEGPRTEEQFYRRLEGMVEAILDHRHITGYCYTQLTDVEQEQNGIYNYDRTNKFDMERIAGIFGRRPAVQ